MTLTATSQVHTTSKAQALRELNLKYAPLQTALNQSVSSNTRALRLLEEQYLRERMEILNSHYYES